MVPGDHLCKDERQSYWAAAASDMNPDILALKNKEWDSQEVSVVQVTDTLRRTLVVTNKIFKNNCLPQRQLWTLTNNQIRHFYDEERIV